MNALAGSLRSVGSQPLSLRMRSDLTYQITQGSSDHRGNVSTRIAVKDPIALRYHSLREDEWFILQQLRETTDLETLRQRYQQQFAPRKVTLAQLQSLLFRFHRSELVVSQTLGQSDMQMSRHHKRVRQRLWQWSQSLLFMRFPGVDPSRFLQRTAPLAAVLLHPLMLLAYAVLVIAAVLLFLTHRSAFVADLPSLGQFLAARELLLLGGVIGLTKIAHELGHAMVCHHRGGGCHEIGPMLLVMTPALYCDTSDAWMMPRRRDRIAVTAAGMATEIVIAAIATFVWYYSQPGWIHQAAINVMLVCSVSTLMFNANPLLRYDGYYLLSDLCNTPNLAQRSRQHFHRLLGSWLLAMRYPPAQRPPRWQARWFLVYSLLALVYRLFITVAILMFLTQCLKPYGLQSLGWLLATFSLGLMLATPLRSTISSLRQPSKLSPGWPRRLLLSGLAIAGLGSLFWIPATHHVAGLGTVCPIEETPVYVHMSGQSVADDDPNARWQLPHDRDVAKGDVLLRLQNRDLQLQLVQSETRLASQQLLLQQLTRSRGHDPAASNQLPYVESALVDLQERVDKLRGRAEALTIVAPHAGRFIAAPPVSTSVPRRGQAPALAAGELPHWDGIPTEPRQSGAWLTTGVRLGSIVPSQRFAVDVPIAASDIEWVRVGQPAVVHLHAFPGKRIEGRVHSIAQHDDTATEPPASAGSPAQAGSAAQATGGSSPAAAAAASQRPERYVVRVELIDSDLPLRYRQRSDVRILVDTRPIAVRVYRWLSATFRLS